MVDIILEVFRAVVLLGTVIFLWAVGRNRFEASPEGWRLIVGGFALLLFGSLLDITDNFESLNGYVVIGDTEAQAFLEKVVGFLGGFVLLSIGLVRWMPRVQFLVREVSQRKRAEEKLRKVRDELEARVEERTARLKAANEALQESEALFKTFIDNLPAEIFIRDADGRFVLVNRAWEKAQGLSSEEAINKTARDIFPMDRADAFMAQDDAVLKTGQVLDREVEFRAQGASLFLHTIKFPILDVRSDTTAIGGIAVDITERKRAEAALRESEALLRQAAEMANLGHWVWDEVEDRCTHCSETLAQMTDVTVEEYLARFATMEALLKDVHPDDRARYEQVIAEARRDARAYDIEFRDVAPSGEYRYLRERGEPICDGGGRVVQTVGTIQDVTDYKQAEAALQEAHDELESRVEQRTAELRKSNEALRNEIAEREKAVGALHHLSARLISAQEDERSRIARELHDDFNQRLALLAVDLERLRDGLPESQERLVDGLASLLRRTKELSSDVHRLSHQLHPSVLQHLGLVAAARSFCKEISEQHDVHIELVHHEVPRSLPSDIALCLYRIVQEAIRNVIKHSGGEGARVEITKTASQLKLQISDNGIGFDPEIDRTHRGLGLLSMRERLRQVDGTISFMRIEPTGTRIDVRIPFPDSNQP